MRVLAFLMVVITLAFTLLAQAAGAADAPRKPAASLGELDQRIAKILTTSGISGGSVAVIENRQVVFAKGYGYSDLKAKKPVTPATVFRAGSISKSLTSIGVMMLVEEGKLSLDARLSDLMPELRFDNPWEATDPVRLVHLLEHTTGFDDFDFRHYMLEGKGVRLSDAVQLYRPYRSRWKPGTRSSYCNSGPVIAGRIIEKVSGQDFASFMATRLTGPLGMAGARWTVDPRTAGLLSKSYKSAQADEERFVDLIGLPSGALMVTPTELARIPLLMLGRGTLDGRTYLSPAAVARVERPETTAGARAGLGMGYGLGNMAEPNGKTVFHGHDGAVDGFRATYEYAPALGAGFVVMVNTRSPVLYDVAEEITHYLERNLPTPKPVARPLAAQDLADYAGFYRTITPRQEKLALVYNLGWQKADAVDGALVFDGTPRVHVGNGVFQKQDAAAPNMVFVRGPEGMEIHTVLGASRKVPTWQVVAVMGFGIAFVAAVIINAAYMLVWIPGAISGRLATRGGVSVRLLPWIALMCLLTCIGVSMVLLGIQDLALLSRPSVPGWVIYATSLALPVLGLVALVEALAGGKGASLFVRFVALLNGVVVTSAAYILFTFGWIGMKIWV